MTLLTLLVIAVGLSFDTFAVSLSCGVVQTRISFREALKIAFVMALFQGAFPVAGYYLGAAFSSYVEPVDHWLAFGLLFLLGARMIYEGLSRKEKQESVDVTRTSILITMGVGTSIDAFVVGIGLGFLKANIWVSALGIAFVTFLASMIAIRLGKSVGKKLGSRVEIAGGILLILIGLKILLDHIVFN